MSDLVKTIAVILGATIGQKLADSLAVFLTSNHEASHYAAAILCCLVALGIPLKKNLFPAEITNAFAEDKVNE